MADRKQFPSGIYGITAELFSRGRTNIEVAEAMMEGGVKILQYREKAHLKSYREILEECRVIGALARRRDVIFIVNDFVDIALLSDADGVHVGQDDLRVSDVRQLLGPDKLIGLSTHSPEQARQAEAAGADYIGVGPLYATKTKEDVCAPVGLAYLDYVVEQITLPFVAIGGIKQHNIGEVVRHGARTVCLVTEIVGSDNIEKMVRELHNSMETILPDP